MRLHILSLLLCVPFLVQSATYTVTNTGNSGSGSLRDALQQAVYSPGAPHQIAFNIPLSDGGYDPAKGTWTINLQSPLPYITSGNILIDASTQTTFAGNTNPHGPEIELDGHYAVDYAFHIFNASNVEIRGFVIRRFIYGIQVSGSHAKNNTIAGNYIGVNHNATDTSGCYIGIEIMSMASENTVGGTDERDRNIVSGNGHIGIRLLHASYNLIINNYVGLDRTGEVALPNYDGISLEAYTQFNIIGGTTPQHRNVVSGNVAYGIPLIGLHTQNNKIIGNFLGTNAAGTLPVPNTYGVLFDDGSRYNWVGGYQAGEANLISGNSGYGVFIYNFGTTENFVVGNLIGTNMQGTLPIPNANGIVVDGIATKHIIDKNLISGNIQQGIAIHISGSNEHVIIRNKIGTDISGLLPLPNGADGIRIAEGGRYNIIGVAPDSGNVIAFNGNNGITIMTPADMFNSISGNSIHSNTAMGIDLYPPGPNPNDPGDNDTGPNNGQNFPVLISAIYDNTTGITTVTGNLDTQNPQDCRIEFFLSADNNGSYGQGKIYLGYTMPLSNGNFEFNTNEELPLNLLCATATDALGNTSEFSENLILPPPASTFEKAPPLFDLRVYPNPTTDVLNIVLPYTMDMTVFIYDPNGKLLLYVKKNSELLKLNLSKWLPGNYNLIVVAENHILSRRFIIMGN